MKPHCCVTICKMTECQFMEIKQLKSHVSTPILDFSDDLPKFATLANIALVIPVNSVPCECERGFSLHNRVKTYQRSRLSDHGGTKLQFFPRLKDFFSS